MGDPLLSDIAGLSILPRGWAAYQALLEAVYLCYTACGESYEAPETNGVEESDGTAGLPEQTGQAKLTGLLGLPEQTGQAELTELTAAAAVTLSISEGTS